MLGDALFLKAYRRVEPGPSPDVEMTSFLTAAGFKSIAALLGVLTHAGEHETVLAALFMRVGHQGDVWTYALNHLERFAAGLDAQDAATAAPHELFATQMQTLGRRVGEMHALLADASTIPRSRPSRSRPRTLRAGTARRIHYAEQVLATLQNRFRRCRARRARDCTVARPDASACSRRFASCAATARGASRRGLTATCISARSCSSRTIC